MMVTTVIMVIVGTETRTRWSLPGSPFPGSFSSAYNKTYNHYHYYDYYHYYYHHHYSSYYDYYCYYYHHYYYYYHHNHSNTSPNHTLPQILFFGLAGSAPYVGGDHKFRSYWRGTPAGLGTLCMRSIYICLHLYTFISFPWGWGLPTLGCLCKALPPIDKALRPAGVWQKGILEPIAFSSLRGTRAAHCTIMSYRLIYV